LQQQQYRQDLKIALGFSYHNNSISEIQRALDQWYDKVDYIIAIDGRYKFPYSPEMLARPDLIPPKFSPVETYDFMDRMYGNKMHFYTMYETQMVKRQRYLDVAGRLGCNVLIVADTDELIHPEYNNWDKFYKQLWHIVQFDEQEPGVLSFMLYFPDAKQYPRQFNNVAANTWVDRTRVHINPGAQRYAVTHYTFCPKTSDNKDIINFEMDVRNMRMRNPYMLYPQGIMCIRLIMDRLKRTPAELEFGNMWAWQLMHDELYREKLQEAQIVGYDKLHKEIYRDEGTYWFNDKGKLVPYTEEEQEVYNSLNLDNK